MILLVGGVLVLALLAIAALPHALKRQRGVTFGFEDRDDYLLLRISGRLLADDPTLLAMRALREALRLKLSMGYLRLLVDARWLKATDDHAFWLLVGGLGPALITNEVRVAMVCTGDRDLTQRIRLAQIDSFERQGPALAFLHLEQAPLERFLDPGWVDSLLLAKRPTPPPPIRRSA